MTLSYRLSPFAYEPDDQFERVLALLVEHRSVVDEIALFTSFTHHLYIPLEKLQRRCEIMAGRMEQLRRAGVPSVGVNMLCTIGHIDEAWDIWPKLPFDNMVGHDGKESLSCACPTSRKFMEYTRAAYRMVAQSKPDFVWVDDDLRMHSHTIEWGCFCERCVKLFARRHRGAPATRKELVRVLDLPKSARLREAWVESNNRTMKALLADIRRTLHRVDPKIQTGLMTYGPGWGSYSGVEYDAWLRRLGASKARPGGGFYVDHCPGEMIYKTFETARQCNLYRGQAKDVQYELENFIYQKLDKSVQSVLNECTLALAAGCNGVAFNALNDTVPTVDDYRDLMAGIERMRPVWDRFVAAAEGLPLTGVWTAWDRRMMGRRQANGDWFRMPREYDFNHTAQLAALGLPITTSREHACATMLTGKLPEIFTDRELRQMLSGGAILDAQALAVLHARGLGELTGIALGKSYDNGVWETLTDHPFNGGSAGGLRDVRTSFGKQLSHALAPRDRNVQDLARLTGYDGRDLGCCAAAFENALGGRVITLGYSPWSRYANTMKRSQLLAMADWVSRGRLPVVIDRTLRVLPMVRAGRDGKRLALVLLNTSLDPTGRFDVRLRTNANMLSLVTPQGKLKALLARRAGNELAVTIGNLGPWQSAVLLS